MERDYLSLSSEYVLALKLPSGQHRGYEEVSLAWWEIPGTELRMSSQNQVPVETARIKVPNVVGGQRRRVSL